MSGQKRPKSYYSSWHTIATDLGTVQVIFSGTQMTIRLLSGMCLVVWLTSACSCSIVDADSSGLSARLSGPQSVAIVDTARFQLTARNTSRVEVAESLAPSKAGFTIDVRDAAGKLVWSSTTGPLASISPVLAIDAGSEVVLSGSWPLEDNGGNRVEPGVYRVHARLQRTNGPTIVSDPHALTLTVVP
jgi:hypothetical protein